MTEKQRQTKNQQKKEAAEEIEEVEAPKDLVDTELTEDVEDILAEIDDVLEVNAEVFVKEFVQRGGQ